MQIRGTILKCLFFWFSLTDSRVQKLCSMVVLVDWCYEQRRMYFLEPECLYLYQMHRKDRKNVHNSEDVFNGCAMNYFYKQMNSIFFLELSVLLFGTNTKQEWKTLRSHNTITLNATATSRKLLFLLVSGDRLSLCQSSAINSRIDRVAAIAAELITHQCSMFCEWYCFGFYMQTVKLHQ